MPGVPADRRADLAALARWVGALAAVGFLWLAVPVDAFASDVAAEAADTTAVLEETASDGTNTEAAVDPTVAESVADEAAGESPAAEPTPAEPSPAPEPAPAPEPPPPAAELPPPAPEPAPPAPEAPPPEPVSPGTATPSSPPAGQAPSIVLLPQSPPAGSEIVPALAPPFVQLAGDPRTGTRARQGSGADESGIPLREAEQPSELAPLSLAGDNGHAPAPGSFGGATGGTSGAPSSGFDIALAFIVALAVLGSGRLLLLLVAQLRPFALVSQLNRPG